MKKICFVTTISLTLKSFVLETAKYLHEQGNYEITFICDNDEEFAKILPEYIKYVPIPMNRGINISGVRATLKLIHLFKKEKYDLVQYSTPNASLYASIAAKLAGIPVRLYCQWGIVFVGFSGLKRKIFKFIEKLVCSFSTWVEPDSFGNLAFSRSEGLYTEEKSSVVWNGSAGGVDLTKFNLGYKEHWRNEIRGKYNINNESYVLGFVGRITADKGINELFSATKQFFEKYPNSILLLVGNKEKPEKLNKDLIRWALDEKRVIYCGTTNEVEKYLAALDLFILPSYREGFGSVVIEAEAMGLPVIVTDIPGPTDAMERNVTGLVAKKENVNSLLDAMIRLRIDNELAERMSKESYLFASSKFDSKELKKHIIDDRERLLRGNLYE